MAYNRAFSDTEIVTIAAVAAAALGGIVVGLGRGQASVAHSPSGTERLKELSSSRLSSARQVLPDRDQLAERAHRLQEQARRLPEGHEIDTSSIRDAFSALTENVRHSELGHELSRLIDQLAEKDGQAFREGARGLKPFSGHGHRRGQLVNVASKAGAAIIAARQALAQHDSNRRESALAGASDAAGAARERLDELAGRISAHLPTHEQSSDARSRASEALERRVAQPVSRAATTTKDTTQEALTAALWLSAAAGLVYFGLLSSERREQVKDFLCGVYEQARLLALDFQGYEADM